MRVKTAGRIAQPALALAVVRDGRVRHQKAYLVHEELERIRNPGNRQAGPLKHRVPSRR